MLEQHGTTIEKLLIGGIMATVIFSLFINEITSFAGYILIVLQILLIGFFMLQLQKKVYGLIWIGFLLNVLSYFIFDYIPYSLYYVITCISFVAFGIVVLVKTFKLSIQNRNFELLNFIMGFLLVLQAALPFFGGKKEIITFYSFALAFSLGTIVYNDNLWHRYSQDEKNIIKYILIIAMVLVIQSSSRYIQL